MPSIRSLLVLCVLCLSLGTTFAVFTADTFITGFQQQSSSLSLSEKKIYYTQISNSLDLLAIKNHKDQKEVALYSGLREFVDEQMDILSEDIVDPSLDFDSLSDVAAGMTIPNVNLAKVRDVWLSLHNAERNTKGLTPYTYSSVLEGTATTWANHLADLRATTHRRKKSDGYYSYASIKSWFQNQGVVFASKESNGQALFTESLGRGMYSCKKADCTDDFIKSIKTSRAFFMSEKGKKSRPHYNAIVGNYSSIGVGVKLIANKYYLVSHYTQTLK